MPSEPLANCQYTIGIYVYDDVEVLDFAGPYEVFTTASRVSRKRRGSAVDPFRVCTIARTERLVRARAGLLVQPDHDLERHPDLDVLVVPGGVVDDELGKAEVIEWIAKHGRSGRLTASVCTGAFLLAEAGLLDGKQVTTHWEDMTELRARYPRLALQKDVRWVDEGSIVTSAGISAGIDMCLHLVERLRDRELASSTARQMEFDWLENPAAGARA